MRKFILGTDWWTDCDDAVAIRLLARMVKRKKCALLGIGINACMEKSVPSLAAFLRTENLSVPIGLDRDAVDFIGTPVYQWRLSEMYGDLPQNSDAEDAVSLYLKLLRSADTKVELIEIGFPQVLNGALKADPSLFAEKVARVWIMGGKWDEPRGLEHNFSNNRRASVAAHEFLEGCPAPVTLLGWEAGATVISGSRLPDGDMLRGVMVDHGSKHGRSSWDPMLMLLAVTGDAREAGYRAVRGTARVDAASGINTFEPRENGLHEYVVEIHEDQWYADKIDEIIAPSASGARL